MPLSDVPHALLSSGGDTLTTPTLLEAVQEQDSDIDQLTCISITPGHANFIEKFAKAAPKAKVNNPLHTHAARLETQNIITTTTSKSPYQLMLAQ